MTEKFQPWATPEEILQGDEFLYIWKDQGVGIGLTSVHEGDRGDVHAEITVQNVVGARASTIERCSLNLASQQTRSRLANDLNKREGHLLDFEKALRYVCFRTVDQHHEGQPMVNLADIKIDRSRRFLIDWMLPYGQLSIFYGDGMSGKSLAAATIAIAVQTGQHVAGIFRPTEQANVAYYDWETSSEEQADRIDQLCNGLRITRPPILYRKPGRLLADDIRRIRSEVDKHNIGFMVVDSMHLACGNLIDFDKVGRFNDALASLPNVTKLVLTHLSKSDARQDNGKASPLGLAQVNNYGRSNWEFRAERDDTNGVIDLAMFHRKVNGFKMQRPIGIRFDFNELIPAITIRQNDVLDSPGLAAHSTTADRIRAALRDGEMTTKDLSESLGLAENIVRVGIARMRDVETTGEKLPSRGGRPSNVYRLVADAPF